MTKPAPTRYTKDRYFVDACLDGHIRNGDIFVPEEGVKFKVIATVQVGYRATSWFDGEVDQFEQHREGQDFVVGNTFWLAYAQVEVVEYEPKTPPKPIVHKLEEFTIHTIALTAEASTLGIKPGVVLTSIHVHLNGKDEELFLYTTHRLNGEISAWEYRSHPKKPELGYGDIILYVAND